VCFKRTKKMMHDRFGDLTTIKGKACVLLEEPERYSVWGKNSSGINSILTFFRLERLFGRKFHTQIQASFTDAAASNGLSSIEESLMGEAGNAFRGCCWDIPERAVSKGR
jgi:hypothetical protein